MSAKREYIRSLARDYIRTIDAIRSGMLSDADIRYLEAERAVLHDQLARAIGRGRISKDRMPRYARSLL